MVGADRVSLPGVIDIRPLAPTDSFDDITDLLHRAYAPLAAKGMHYVASHQSADVTRDRALRGETFVAIEDGRIVGTITLEPAPASVNPTAGGEFYDQPGIAHFGQYAVDPRLKGTGLGKRLLRRIEERAKELGAVELALDTSVHASGLIALYERWGYRHVGDIDWRPSVNYPSVVLSKTL